MIQTSPFLGHELGNQFLRNLYAQPGQGQTNAPVTIPCLGCVEDLADVLAQLRMLARNSQAGLVVVERGASKTSNG